MQYMRLWLLYVPLCFLVFPVLARAECSIEVRKEFFKEFFELNFLEAEEAVISLDGQVSNSQDPIILFRGVEAGAHEISVAMPAPTKVSHVACVDHICSMSPDIILDQDVALSLQCSNNEHWRVKFNFISYWYGTWSTVVE